MSIQTKEDFDAFVVEVEGREGYVRPAAFGVGIAHVDSNGVILCTFFPAPNLNLSFGTAAVLSSVTGHKTGTETVEISHAGLESALEHFTPFAEDGFVHPNITAIRDIAALVKDFSEGYIDPHTVKNTLKALVVFIDADSLNKSPTTIPDAYLRLHLLSHRLVKPNEICLDGIFGILPNVIWTSEGPRVLWLVM